MPTTEATRWVLLRSFWKMLSCCRLTNKCCAARSWIDNIGRTISNPLMEFGVEGDLAYHVATYAFKDTKSPDYGKFVEIFRRQQDGTWKVYLCIYNSDKPA